MAASADDAAAAAATLVRKYAQQEPDSDAEAADGDGVPLLGTSQLNALVKACATAGGREGFFAHKRHGDTVLDRLVAVLNGDPEHVGGKAKLTALAVIAELSRVDSAKDSVLDAVRQVSERFEKYLSDKEAARAQFGTQLGRYHDLMLVALLRLCDYSSAQMGAAEVLEFLNGDVSLCLSVICAALRVATYEDEVPGALCGVLGGFAQPATYLASDGKVDDVETAVTEHGVTDFCEKVDALVLHVERASVVNVAVEALSPRLFGRVTAKQPQPDTTRPLAPPLIAGVTALLRLLQNIYLFSTKGSAAFRQHLLASTSLVQSLLVPFIVACGHSIATDPSTAKGLLPAASVAMQSMVMATFRMARQRDVARRLNPAVALLADGATAVAAKPPLVALALLLCVNCDALSASATEASKNDPVADGDVSGADPEQIVAAIRSCLASLGAAGTRAVAARVRGTSWLPVERDNSSYRRVEALLEEADDLSSGGSDDDEEEGPVASDAKVEEAAEGEAKGPEADATPVSVVGAESSSSGVTTRVDGGEAAADGSVAAAGAAEAAEAAEKRKADEESAAASASGTHSSLKDLPTLGGDASSQVAGGAGGSAPLDRGSSLRLPKQNADDAERRRRRKEKRRRAKATSGEGGATGKKGKEKKKSKQKKELRETGDGAEEWPAAKHTFAAASDSAKVPRDVDEPLAGDSGKRDFTGAPSEFLCQINGHVMKTPVSKGPGHPVFEKTTIELWLEKQGLHCPITGEELTAADLKVDVDLQRRITEWHIKRAMEVQKPDVFQDEDELYDF